MCFQQWNAGTATCDHKIKVILNSGLVFSLHRLSKELIQQNLKSAYWFVIGHLGLILNNITIQEMHVN